MLCQLAGATSDTRGVAAACRAVVDAAPETAQAHFLLGHAANRGRRWGEARGHLRRALELDDKTGDTWSQLATSCEQLGARDELAALQARYRERYGWELRPDPPADTQAGRAAAARRP